MHYWWKIKSNQQLHLHRNLVVLGEVLVLVEEEVGEVEWVVVVVEEEEWDGEEVEGKSDICVDYQVRWIIYE